MTLATSSALIFVLLILIYSGFVISQLISIKKLLNSESAAFLVIYFHPLITVPQSKIAWFLPLCLALYNNLSADLTIST
jgi:hypothetical protein